MDKNFEPSEKKNFEFVEKQQSRDYLMLLERLKSIKKAISLLENSFTE